MRSFPSYLAASALLVALVAGGACAPKGQPASSAGQAPAAPRSPGAAGAGSIQCGKALCKAGSEVCCGNQYTGSCRPDAGPDLAGLNKDERARRTVEHLVRVAGSCNGSVVTCDTSVDCPAGQRCCASRFGPEIDLQACSEHCELNEACVAGAPCRTPGTVCLHGSCQLPRERLRCGAASCGGETQCCGTVAGEQLHCAARCEGATPMGYSCLSNRDCPEGAFCQSSMVSPGAYCSFQRDIGGLMLVCRNSADCAGECQVSGGSPKCEDGYCTCG